MLLGVQEAIGEEFVGVYLRGSLALGGFDPITSDLDFLVVTKHPPSEKMFADLNVLNTRLAKHPNAYAEELEGTYIDCNALKRFRRGNRYPTIARGDVLRWSEHHANWILERWTVRSTELH